MASRSAQSSLLRSHQTKPAKRPRLDSDSDSNSESEPEADAQTEGQRSREVKNVKTKTKSKQVGTSGAVLSENVGAAYKSKCLVLASRGVTYHMRHLMNDVIDLLPHSKKDAKLDNKHQLSLINELADLYNCNHALYFESRRHHDLYLWATQCPNGPSIRFHVVNMHTMGEVNMTGNCLKGSRPIVVFGKEFDTLGSTAPVWNVCRHVLSQVFAVPKTARRAKPFVDHVISLNIIQGKIWFRNYQIINKEDDESPKGSGGLSRDGEASTATWSSRVRVTEIGPRFTLVPVKVLEGSFGGPCLWENREFVPPIQAQQVHKQRQASQYARRQDQDQQRYDRQRQRAEDVEKIAHVTGTADLAQRVVFA